MHTRMHTHTHTQYTHVHTHTAHNNTEHTHTHTHTHTLHIKTPNFEMIPVQILEMSRHILETNHFITVFALKILI